MNLMKNEKKKILDKQCLTNTFNRNIIIHHHLVSALPRELTPTKFSVL